MAMQDPAAVAVQEDAANAEDAEVPEKPQAKAKRHPRAAKDGKWRTTEDGGKMFIGDDGDVNFGGPGGEPAKEAAPPKNPTHNVKLPRDKKRLGEDAANTALKQMGMEIKRNTKKDPKTGNISTTYQLKKQDGSTEDKTLSEIRDFIYETSESAKPKKKVKALASSDFDESKITRDDDGKFGGGGGGSGVKKTATAADIGELPTPKRMRADREFVEAAQDQIFSLYDEGKTADEIVSFMFESNDAWDMINDSDLQKYKDATQKHLDKMAPDADTIDGPIWEDWLSDNTLEKVQKAAYPTLVAEVDQLLKRGKTNEDD